MYTWECSYCTNVVENDSQGEVITASRDHLLAAHRSAMADAYASRLANDRCHECGVRLFDNPDSVEDFICPNCGFDNLQFYTDKRVWQGIETVE